jgi:hypothetical protein
VKLFQTGELKVDRLQTEECAETTGCPTQRPIVHSKYGRSLEDRRAKEQGCYASCVDQRRAVGVSALHAILMTSVLIPIQYRPVVSSPSDGVFVKLSLILQLGYYRTLRRTNSNLPHAFFSDWARIALDESKHFTLLTKRLVEISSSTPYGSLPAHAGLWESARVTFHSLRSRLAIIHLVHEARGLDVNPVTIEKFRTERRQGYRGDAGSHSHG